MLGLYWDTGKENGNYCNGLQIGRQRESIHEIRHNRCSMFQVMDILSRGHSYTSLSLVRKKARLSDATHMSQHVHGFRKLRCSLEPILFKPLQSEPGLSPNLLGVSQGKGNIISM